MLPTLRFFGLACWEEQPDKVITKSEILSVLNDEKGSEILIEDNIILMLIPVLKDLSKEKQVLLLTKLKEMLTNFDDPSEIKKALDFIDRKYIRPELYNNSATDFTNYIPY